MAWDDTLQRELSDEEAQAIAEQRDRLASSIHKEEARTGQLSVLRNHPILSRPTELPEINVTPETQREIDNEPDVIAVEDKPSGHNTPVDEPKKETTAADLLKTLHEGSRGERAPAKDETEPNHAEELAALLHPEAPGQIDTGSKPVWPPTPIMTGAEALSLPPDQRPRNMAELLQRAQGVDPTQQSKIDTRNTDPIKQFASKAAGGLASAPYMMAAGVTSIPEYGMRSAGLIDDSTPSLAESLMGHGQDIQESVRNALGASPEPQGFAKLAGTAGSSVVPAGQYTAPLSAAMLAANLGVENFAPSANAATKKAEPVPPIPWSVEQYSNQVDPSPSDIAYVNKYPTNDVLNSFEQRFGSKGLDAMSASLSQTEALATKSLHPIDTIGGQTQVKEAQLKTLGWMAAVSLGAAFAPSIYSKIKYTALPAIYPNAPWMLPPKTRPVVNAAPGTETFSTQADRMRGYDDAGAGVLRFAKKAGLPGGAAAIKDLTDTIGAHTGAAAQSFARTATLRGHAETPTFVFKVNTSLTDLNKQMTPQRVDYLHTLNVLDNILKEETRQAFLKNPNPTPGPVTIRGMTSADAIARIKSLEAVDPMVRNIAAAFQENTKALRKFESNGEYATVSQVELKKINTQNPNEIPGFKITEDLSVEQPNPVDFLATSMEKRLRDRIQNEVVGTYITQVQKSQHGGDVFKPVTTEELKNKRGNAGLPNMTDNPNWKPNSIRYKVRGQTKYVTADPWLVDSLKLDPYFNTSSAVMVLNSGKRLFEAATTGLLKPGFALTDSLRNEQIAQITTPAGRRKPTVLGSVYALPQQLVPQIADKIAEALNGGSLGWLSHVMGQSAVNSTARWMSKAYADSLYAQLQPMGSHRGSYMQHAEARGNLRLAAQQATGPSSDLFRGVVSLMDQVENTKTFKTLFQNPVSSAVIGSAKTLGRGYRNVVDAGHNLPQFNYVSRNAEAMSDRPMMRARDAISKPQQPHEELDVLAQEARELTGNPQTSGRYYTPEGKSIRFDTGPNKTVGSEAAKLAAGTYGFAQEVGREIVPWHNMTTQGAKRLGKAYLENPVKFVRNIWTYVGMPTAALWLYNRSLGNDPNGVNYSEYQMLRRSDYNTLMNTYFAIPGLPAEQGIEIPGWHESRLFANMTDHTLDHMFRSNIFTEAEDFKYAANSFLQTVLVPPAPPIANLVLAKAGMTGSGNLFGGESYIKKNDPFDSNAGMSGNIELIVRAIAPAIAEIGGDGLAAYTHTKTGYMGAIGNTIEAMAKRVTAQTPIVKNIFDLTPPAAGNSRMVDMAFQKKKAIDLVGNYMKDYGMTGKSSIKQASDRGPGRAYATQVLGEPIPTQHSGLDREPPTNPLYLQFMSSLYDQTNKPSFQPNEYRGLWSEYYRLTKDITAMHNIDGPNMVTWRERMSQQPEQLEYLKRNGPSIDVNDPRAVRSFYERKREDAAREIYFHVKKIEDAMTQELAAKNPQLLDQMGGKVLIENLHPYTDPSKTPGAPSALDPYGAPGQ